MTNRGKDCEDEGFGRSEDKGTGVTLKLMHGGLRYLLLKGLIPPSTRHPRVNEDLSFLPYKEKYNVWGRRIYLDFLGPRKGLDDVQLFSIQAGIIMFQTSHRLYSTQANHHYIPHTPHSRKCSRIYLTLLIQERGCMNQRRAR